jgi:hypothetical protein
MRTIAFGISVVTVAGAMWIAMLAPAQALLN